MQLRENLSLTVRPGAKPPEWLIVVGASTGGPQALARLLPDFPADIPATIVVVQQMRPGFCRVLANQLNHVCDLPIYEPEDGQALQSSRILMVPSGTSLKFEQMTVSGQGWSILLEDVRDNINRHSNRTNETMREAVQVFGRKCIGVLLTGTGNDGCEGLRDIATAGGITIAQDEASSVVHDLPASAIEAGVASEVLPLWNITERIIRIIRGDIDAVAA